MTTLAVDPANSVTSASPTVLGLGAPIRDAVGGADPRDVFIVTAPSAGVLQLRLDGLSSDADLVLFRGGSNRQQLSGSYYFGPSIDLVLYPAAAGETFIVSVEATSTSSTTPYQLTAGLLSVDPWASTDPGDMPGTARALAATGGTVAGSLNFADLRDVYRLIPNASGRFDVRLEGLTGNADVIVYGGDDIIVARGSNAGTTAEILSFTAAAGMPYYLEVQNIAGVATVNYSLTVASSPPASPPPAAPPLLNPTEGADSLTGTAGPDLIAALGGNDVISAGVGDDTIFGGSGNDVIDGGAGRNSIDGGGGNDAVNGGDSPDWLDGGADADTLGGLGGGDTLLGGSGNDLLFGSLGDDVIQGGSGTDTAAFGVTREQTTFTRDGFDFTVSSSEGSDTLRGVERLRFGITIDPVLGALLSPTLAFDVSGTAGQAYRLYQAAFARTPDAPGLGYWVRRLDAGLVDLSQAAQSFAASPEFQSHYGTLNDSGFVRQLYRNVLGREGEASGVDFWLGELGRGVTRGVVLAGFSESAENMALTARATADGIWFV